MKTRARGILVSLALEGASRVYGHAGVNTRSSALWTGIAIQEQAIYISFRISFSTLRKNIFISQE